MRKKVQGIHFSIKQSFSRFRLFCLKITPKRVQMQICFCKTKDVQNEKHHSCPRIQNELILCFYCTRAYSKTFWWVWEISVATRAKYTFFAGETSVWVSRRAYFILFKYNIITFYSRVISTHETQYFDEFFDFLRFWTQFLKSI